MELEILEINIGRLINYWKEQGIKIYEASLYDLEKFESDKHIHLPIDFKEYFCRANGMPAYYPNYMDKEGFLFYPLQQLVTIEEEFSMNRDATSNDRILIFAEYMHKSWWYGVKLSEINKTYEIGIIPVKDIFKPITSSLSAFIDLYLQDGSALYGY